MPEDAKIGYMVAHCEEFDCDMGSFNYDCPQCEKGQISLEPEHYPEWYTQYWDPRVDIEEFTFKFDVGCKDCGHCITAEHLPNMEPSEFKIISKIKL